MQSDLSASVIAAGLLFVGGSVVEAQQPPPIGGVTGTTALEGTVEKTYEGLNTIVVKTVDGIEHLFHLTDRTVVHGGKAAGGDVLRGLEEGSRVVVHYTVEGEHEAADEVDRVGADGLKTTEGVITNVNRGAKTMTIRLADGSVQRFRLTERAAAEVGKDIEKGGGDFATVVVYVDDDAGRPIAHFFRRVL